MKYDELAPSHGYIHGSNDPGEGITLEDLYQIIRRIPRKVRGACYMQIAMPDGRTEDLRGLQFGHSDQAEAHEFSCHVRYTGDDK